MTKPLVTIALPAYKVAESIESCLASLVSQDYPADRLQIVVGDNGSTDGTAALIAKAFPTVQVISAAEGRGSAYARNAAFGAARGEYICSIDSDCVADPRWVSALIHAFEDAPESVACLGGSIEPYRVATLTERCKNTWIGQDEKRDGIHMHYAATPNAAFRRAVIEKVGLFDLTQGFDDVDLGMRLREAGYEIRYVAEAVVRHRNPVTLADLYKQRMKYGVFYVNLQRKYPAKLGDPDTPAVQRRLFIDTTRRIVGALFFHLPRALLFGDAGVGTRLWPILKIVENCGYYVGVRKAIRTPKPVR